MMAPFWKEFLEKTADKKDVVLLSIVRQVSGADFSNNILTLICSNVGLQKFISDRKADLERYIEQYMGVRAQVELIIDPKASKKELPLVAYEPSKEDVFTRAGLNLKYKFENFAVSSSNQVAYAAAQAVAANPGGAYNPLFLYGGVGVGKTHLTQAIARLILERDNEKKALFAPGDRFINEHIESIREHTAARFRRKYRYLNIVIVDDVQFIAGKQSVQDEFFHVFNSVVSSGGQIVLTSDRPPTEIKNLADRLRSRFSGGLIVDIQPPDFELRSAILLIKAREKNFDIDIEAAKIIAERVEETRGLEGALISIYATTLEGKNRIDLEAVEKYFDKKITRAIKRVSPTDIIRLVCSFYNVKQSQIKSPNRSEHIALTRQIIMYLLKRELNLNLQDIANLLNRKDHTTVMHGEKKIEGLLMKDQNLKEQVDKIVQTIHSST